MLLYIHIPFCDSKCSYCAFNSYVDKFHLKADYMKALHVQLEFELKRFKAEPFSIETLFIGGGTPSTIEPNLYKPIFDILKPYFCEDVEVTTEANPNSASKEWLKGMRELGVNRVSFGVQSFNNEKLKLLNRSHNSNDAKKAVLSAKEVGFENISLDIIYATAGDTKELLEVDIQTAFSLPINHISAYALTIEENTPFEKKPEMSVEKLALTEWFFEKIISKGFKQYEVSNFGNYQSRHNIGYWRYKDYLGVGSGAVGKLNEERFYPTINIEEYIKNPLNIRVETLHVEDINIEKLFLGFRSNVGVCENILTPTELSNANILVEEKKLHYKNRRFYNHNFLLADELVLFIV